MEKANLYYSIFLGKLWGSAAGQSLSIAATSGGRGGSTTPGAVATSVRDNPFKIGQKTDHASGVHGGPLPIGKYRIDAPIHSGHMGRCAKLTPVDGGISFGMFGRSGFFIHGRGPHGSDGCIVPLNGSEFQKLMKALAESGGGELIVLP